MFSSILKKDSSSYNYMWLITPSNSSNIIRGDTDGTFYGYPITDIYAVRPTVNLKSNIIITGGDGTEQHPFEIALGSE